MYRVAQGKSLGTNFLKALAKSKPGETELLMRNLYKKGLAKEASPKKNWASTELNAKCSSPPATLNIGLIITCSTAIQHPRAKRVKLKTK